MSILPQSAPASLFDGKCCSSCQSWKPLTDFHRNGNSPDGRYSKCKPCKSVVRNAHHAANRDKDNKRSMEWYNRHKSDESFFKRRRIAANRWHKENEPRRKIWRITHRISNQEHYREMSRANRQKRRARVRGNGGSYTKSQWIELCARYDLKCLCCGLRKKLTPDHVVPLASGGTSNIDNIQPLCLNCNCSKKAKTIDYRS